MNFYASFKFQTWGIYISFSLLNWSSDKKHKWDKLLWCIFSKSAIAKFGSNGISDSFKQLIDSLNLLYFSLSFVLSYFAIPPLSYLLYFNVFPILKLYGEMILTFYTVSFIESLLIDRSSCF